LSWRRSKTEGDTTGLRERFSTAWKAKSNTSAVRKKGQVCGEVRLVKKEEVLIWLMPYASVVRRTARIVIPSQSNLASEAWRVVGI
jgi:hypothetical protein